jgi:hypothetical protein
MGALAAEGALVVSRGGDLDLSLSWLLEEDEEVLEPGSERGSLSRGTDLNLSAGALGRSLGAARLRSGETDIRWIARTGNGSGR